METHPYTADIYTLLIFLQWIASKRLSKADKVPTYMTTDIKLICSKGCKQKEGKEKLGTILNWTWWTCFSFNFVPTLTSFSLSNMLTSYISFFYYIFQPYSLNYCFFPLFITIIVLITWDQLDSGATFPALLTTMLVHMYSKSATSFTY